MLTVGVGQDFKPHYQILSGKEKTVARLKDLQQKALEIYVASDPDREGESIGWHILQAAGIKNYKRVAFKEITKSCISAELSSPRRLDLPKVASQECRRVIDRLVGYLVTPELRRVMGRPTTAGRVQSVAVYLVVLREREIRAFTPIKHFGWNWPSFRPATAAPGRRSGIQCPRLPARNFRISRIVNSQNWWGLYAM